MGTMAKKPWLAILILMASGCSGSSEPSGSDGEGGIPIVTEPSDFDASTVTGLTTCEADASFSSHACGCSITLQGAISGTFSFSNACGTSGPLLSWSDFQKSRVGVAIAFMGMTPPVDQIGTFPLAYVEISQPRDASQAALWKTAGGCSATIIGSICAPTSVFHNRRVLSGTVTCTTPAMPQLDNMAEPIQISDFSFLGFIDPR